MKNVLTVFNVAHNIKDLSFSREVMFAEECSLYDRFYIVNKISALSLVKIDYWKNRPEISSLHTSNGFCGAYCRTSKNYMLSTIVFSGKQTSRLKSI